MFRKREFRIQMHKAQKPESTDTTPKENQLGEKLLQLAPKILIGGVFALYGYVLLDTYRQVSVAQSTLAPE